jgi:hypothetical protein
MRLARALCLAGFAARCSEILRKFKAVLTNFSLHRYYINVVKLDAVLKPT